MTTRVRSIAASVLAGFARFRSNAHGNVAIVFAFASVAVAVGVGAGLDLSGAFAARQRLSEVAALTCQYSNRPSVVNTQSSTATSSFATYTTAVNTFASNALAAQHLDSTQVTGSGGGAYFTSTSGTTGPINGVTDLSMTYPTAFLKIMKVTSIPVHAKINCQDVVTTSQIVTGSKVLVEGFEVANCTSYCFTQPSGVSGTLENPTTTFGSSPTYTGSNGFAWYVIGYCLEIDNVGVINSTTPEGTHSAELDCDNASGKAGNSSMSTKVYLSSGSYELRYFYRSRVQYPNYDPYYICGSNLSDVSWANDSAATGFAGAVRTNQVNVYLDPATNTGYPPLHYTANAPNSPTQQLAGSNLIDTCVYSYKWIERSITVNVSTSQYLWLTFAADGQNDSYGAQIDSIRLCPGTCAGAPQDNFPDTTPQTVPVLGTQSTKLTAAMALQATWGWNNYIHTSGTFITPLCGATTAATAFSSCTDPTNTADQTVLLDPGFYELTYYYLSLATFTGAPKTGCSTTTSLADVATMQGQSVTARDPRVLNNNTYSTKADIDLLGVFLSFPGQTLVPSAGTPTLASPLIDACYYSTSPVRRIVPFQITKPGLYNLAFYAAAGSSTTKYQGGAVGTLTGMSLLPLASPYTRATSTACAEVPTPNPQVGDAVTSSGATFSTTATDPFLRGASTTACAP